jgi:hypothetical protein
MQRRDDRAAPAPTDTASLWHSVLQESRNTMPMVIAYHDVKDKDLWLASNTREEFFGPLGVTNIRTFVDPSTPTRVGLLMDVPDLDAVAAALQTPAAAEAEAHDGVVTETLVILVEESSGGAKS